MSNANNLVPQGAVKFRENNADSVIFRLPGHSVERPRSLTVTRTIPEPRRGHLGTQKYFFNFRITTNIGTDEVVKLAPVIVKIETSIPVGASDSDIATALGFVDVLTNPSDSTAGILDTLRSGLLPEAAGPIGATHQMLYLDRGESEES